MLDKNSHLVNPLPEGVKPPDLIPFLPIPEVEKDKYGKKFGPLHEGEESESNENVPASGGKKVEPENKVETLSFCTWIFFS